MMNRNEQLAIAKRLRHLTELEMSRDDLEQLLQEELSNPETDTEFVQQLLEILEDLPSPEQQHESWQKITKRLSGSRRQPILSGLARIAAIGVVLVAIMMATYGTARAFNWEFLLRLMKPFAETFLVYSGDTPEPTATPAANVVYGDTTSSTAQVNFATLADCPDDIAGYPAKPAWMPERFTYAMGSMYTDMQVTSVTHYFSSGAGDCIVDVSVVTEGNDINSYKFEQLPDENMSTNVAGYQIAFYRNTDSETLTASWVAENAHYFISGTVTTEEIFSILEDMMK